MPQNELDPFGRTLAEAQASHQETRQDIWVDAAKSLLVSGFSAGAAAESADEFLEEFDNRFKEPTRNPEPNIHPIDSKG